MTTITTTIKPGTIATQFGGRTFISQRFVSPTQRPQPMNPMLQYHFDERRNQHVVSVTGYKIDSPSRSDSFNTIEEARSFWRAQRDELYARGFKVKTV